MGNQPQKAAAEWQELLMADNNRRSSRLAKRAAADDESGSPRKKQKQKAKKGKGRASSSSKGRRSRRKDVRRSVTASTTTSTSASSSSGLSSVSSSRSRSQPPSRSSSSSLTTAPSGSGSAASTESGSGVASGSDDGGLGRVPAFNILCEDEVERSFDDLLLEDADGGVVFFFYPRANTGGCTKQACGYRDVSDDFAAAGYAIVGVSRDNPTPQTNWKNKHDLPYHLLCDKESVLIGAWGLSKNGGKSIIRSHVVVDRSGKVLDISRRVKPVPSVAAALAFVQGL